MLKIRKLWSQYKAAPKDYKIETPLDEMSDIVASFNFPSPPAIYESMYSFIQSISSTDPPQAGRFRILTYEVEYDGMRHIASICEQWKGGWVHCFQLIDEYDFADLAIERMEEMMEAFLTGKKPSEKNKPKPYTPIQKKRPTKPKIKKIDISSFDQLLKDPKPEKNIKSSKTEPDDNPDKPDGKDDDFDWI